MSLMSCASVASISRGYDYYLDHRATVTRRINATQYQGNVAGNDDAVYIDLDHPRKSSCNCPHAEGKRIICKHMVALFFTAYPLEAKHYGEEIIEYEREEERRQEELERMIIAHIRRMKMTKLQETLLRLLYEGPEWQLERFVRDYMI